jgi:hypothetical protein
MMRAAGRFLVRVGWTFLWLVENVYLNLIRTTGPARPIHHGYSRGEGGPNWEDMRDAARMDEQHQALRLSDIWGRSQRVEHEIAERQGHQLS